MQEAELGFRIPALADLPTFILGILVVVALPYAGGLLGQIVISRMRFYQKIKNQRVAVLLLITSGIGGMIMGVFGILAVRIFGYVFGTL